MNRLALSLGNSLFNTNDSFPRNAENVGPLISSIASTALTLAGITSILLIVGGGIAVIASAGGSSPQGAAKGKAAATAGIVGFLLVFAAYWIVQAVEIITGVEIF